uniref:DNA 5'-3' helicase n=1 Tax=viral metagenome TaxID=1070528 RepID=A0A6M3KEE3_9ZZZZ
MGMIEKLPPHDIEAEEAVIGSLLIDGDCMSKIAYSLDAADFYYEQDQALYQACQSLYQQRKKINSITVGHELQDNNKLESSGGVAHLSHLISICPTSLDVEHYAGVVKELSARRALIALSDRLATIGYDSVKDVPGKVSELVKDYLVKHSGMEEYITPKEAGGMVLDLIDKYNQPKWAMQWGFRDLDDLTSGIFPGELIIIGARPRIGKTQLMIDIAQNVLEAGKSVLFCSAEMTVAHILERRVARELGKPIKILRKYGVDADQMDRIVNLAGELSESNLYFLKHGASSLDIYNKALKIKESLGLDLVFIDYLQKLRDCYSEKENENVRIGRACQRVHDIAVDLDIPVICAAQFNRNQEYRSDDNKVPVISDLRGSGSIEQDADVILLLWRDGPKDPVLNIRMAKTRQVEPGDDIKLTWLKEKRRYADYTTGVE